MTHLDTFVGNRIIIDKEIYQLWVNGCTATDATRLLKMKGILNDTGATLEMLHSDIMDQYRHYSMLESFLKDPPRLQKQIKFQLMEEMQTYLTEKYYEFDAVLVREILGRKMTSRLRNNLDDISDKTKVPLRSCLRQYDNIKRVFKVVEEIKGSLVHNIMEHFCLSDHLARQYAAVVFMASLHFEVNKKKVTHLTFEDFVHCANEMITHWTYNPEDSDREDADLELDREFLKDLRDLKELIDKDCMEDHRIQTLKSVQSVMLPAAYADTEKNFKVYSKALVNIGTGLNHSKELRDLFLDLEEKFIEPCKAASWTSSDAEVFLHVYRSSAGSLPFFRENPHLTKAWDRFMKTISSCILQIFHS